MKMKQAVERMADAIGDFLFNHGKLRAVIFTGIFSFVLTAGTFIAIIFPLVVFGVKSWADILGHALAAGTGTFIAVTAWIAIVFPEE